jgi:hypothetical protein
MLMALRTENSATVVSRFEHCDADTDHSSRGHGLMVGPGFVFIVALDDQIVSKYRYQHSLGQRRGPSGENYRLSICSLAGDTPPKSESFWSIQPVG